MVPIPLVGAEKYQYTKDLRCLEEKRSLEPMDTIPEVLRPIRTPLIVDQWKWQLKDHPDHAFSDYILQGLQNGFHIGVDREAAKLKSASANMKSAVDNPQVIQDRLMTECMAGRVIGPLPMESYPMVHISRFGVIPKKHQPGKWRMIVDLSSPSGHSVNDAIDKDQCSLQYASVDDAVQIILSLGKATQLAKFDIENAYRLIPVHPSDRLLLGMEWEGQLYVDATLPFGLRSAPKIFNALADGLQWILETKGVSPLLHYLDDFLLFGCPHTQNCSKALMTALSCCGQLGVPIASKKTEGPSSSLTFLGMEIDTEAIELKLPVDKLGRLQKEISLWNSRKFTTKRDLLSLIGQLQHPNQNVS